VSPAKTARSAVRKPQQDRSRKSLEAIYAAAVDVLGDGGWEAVTIGEIERRSGVSRGTFYLRFPTRDALVEYVGARLIEEIRQRQDEVFNPLREGGSLDLPGAVELVIGALADVFAGVGRVMIRLARPEAAEGGASAVAELDADVAQVLSRVEGHELDRGRVSFALELVFAGLVSRQRALPAFGAGPQLDDEAWRAEMTRVVTAYLLSA
jgi:AcrR family transcriptional regulator